MKTKIRDIVSICIFIILTSLTVILVQPAYGKLSSGVASYARGLKKTVEEQYFMQISYKSLSPSILSSVNFKDVTVSSVDGKKIASIERIRLDYKLFSLLRGDFTNGFKSLVVDGAQVSGSELALLIQENQKNQKNLKVSEVSEKTEKQTKNESFDVSMIFSDVPISVLIKNASVTYINREINAEASIKKMNLDYNNKTKQLAIGSDTQVQAIYNNRKYYGNLLFDGKLFEGFENSSATFSFQGLTDGNYRLSKLSFLLGYNDDVISLSTIKNTYPLDIRAGYNFKTQSVSAYLKANELAASSVISVRKKTDLYRKIANLSLTTDSYVSFDVKDNKLDYFSDTGVYLPDTLIPMGAEVKLALKGNDKKINIDNVSINGEKYKAQGNLESIFENMNVSGFIGIPSVELPEGSVLSSAIYFDPLEKGFIAFIPQLFIGENVFTALQLTGEPGEDSIDFNFEGFDYSHMEADTPGKISIDGSYLFSDNYIQTSLSANSFYLDSIWKTVLCFVDEKSRKSMESATNTLKDFVCSADGYLSSDFTSVTYNVPYILAANTKKENQALLLAFDGNEQTVSLTQADLVYGKIAVQGTGSLDILKEDNEMFMIVDLNSGGIPYHFTGNVANNVFSMSGDYNTFVRVDFSRNENINGSASFDNLPFRVIDASLITTLYGDFSVSEQDGFLVELERFEIEEVGNSLQIKPRLSMS